MTPLPAYGVKVVTRRIVQRREGDPKFLWLVPVLMSGVDLTIGHIMDV